MVDPKKTIFVDGGNGSPNTTQDDVEHGKELARRYRCEFVDLKNFHIQHELFRKIPVDLMFRYNFVPLEDRPDGRLVVAIADPSQLMMIDEIGLLLGRRITTRVASLSQINDILKKCYPYQQHHERELLHST